MYDSIPSAVGRLIPILEGVQGWESLFHVNVARDMLAGNDVTTLCTNWLRSVFPTPPPPRPRRQFQRADAERVPRGRQRCREYARVHEMIKKNLTRAAREILDDQNDSTLPGLAEMTDFWKGLLTTPSVHVPRPHRPEDRQSLLYIWHAVTCEEARAVSIPSNSAPGIDGITAKQWRAVPASVKALFFNIILATGGFAPELLESRTVFIPKKAESVTPADFRPISIASTVVRHLHKILAEGAHEANLVDVRQRCLDDGCAENITALAALLYDARANLREINVSSLDYAKAYTSVSHEAISAVLEKNGLPPGFIRYVNRVCSNSTTRLEIEGSGSEPIKVTRGVRQGDPLSSWLFCLAVNRVLKALTIDSGMNSRTNASTRSHTRMM